MAINVNIGKWVIEKLAVQGRSVNWLARMLGKDASNFHKQLKNNFIDVHLLGKINEILDCDFFADLSQLQEKQKANKTMV